MIRSLRRKFIIILMSVASLILTAIFASMLISMQTGNRRISESILRQALFSPESPQEFRPRPEGNERGFRGLAPPAGRIPVVVAEVKGEEITFLVNRLHFTQEGELERAIRLAASSEETGGTFAGLSLRWLKSDGGLRDGLDGGLRVALADISMEQEMLKGLIINSLLTGGASLLAFFLISVLLSRWAVRPVELAWERQRQFVADASHELKTPLTVILSNANMLSGSAVFADAKAARRMEHITAEACRMKKLLESLLELAGSDCGGRERILEKVDLSFEVTNAVLTFEPVVFDERKRLSYDIKDGVSVIGESARLRQLASILLDNAVKYCPVNGKISVSLKENKKAALLTVENDGAPLSETELSLVFERFYRVDEARSAHGGFGLGLSIAKSVAEEHGGKIWAQSEANNKNRFIAELPLCL